MGLVALQTLTKACGTIAQFQGRRCKLHVTKAWPQTVSGERMFCTLENMFPPQHVRPLQQRKFPSYDNLDKKDMQDILYAVPLRVTLLVAAPCEAEGFL